MYKFGEDLLESHEVWNFFLNVEWVLLKNHTSYLYLNHQAKTKWTTALGGSGEPNFQSIARIIQ